VIIHLHVVLDVDPAKWDAAFHTGTEQAAVRSDVRAHTLKQIQDSAAADETGLTARIARYHRPPSEGTTQ
jgi:hypothetical protein